MSRKTKFRKVNLLYDSRFIHNSRAGTRSAKRVEDVEEGRSSKDEYKRKRKLEKERRKQKKQNS